MNLKFVRASSEYTKNSLREFLIDSQSDDFQEYICGFYPELEPSKIKNQPRESSVEYLNKTLECIYTKSKDVMDDSVRNFQNDWDDVELDILEAFSSIFGFNLQEYFQEFTVQVGLNPICPRYLNDNKFDCYFKLNRKSALENTIHEITHFPWFKLWRDVFPQCDKKTFEYPHIIWIFSEIAIDPILRDARLKAFCLNDKPAYDSFYKIEVDGSSLIEKIRLLYRENTLEDFMKKGLELCERYKDTLLKYI